MAIVEDIMATNKAKREFEILKETTKDAIILPFEKEIMALVKKFSNSGQTGGTAPYTAGAISNAVKDLCLHKLLTPLTNKSSEWNKYVNSQDEELYQNNRLCSVFKTAKDPRSYYLDAIVFEENNGNCFTGNVKLYNGEVLSSKQFIKTFPFTPKTFYVNVTSTEWADEAETVMKEGGGWWSHLVKNEQQLKEVFDYYEKE